jgi:hypothetical protein
MALSAFSLYKTPAFRLADEMGSRVAKFKLESLLIDRLEKTTSEFFVNLKSRSDDLISLVIHFNNITEKENVVDKKMSGLESLR